MLHLAKRQQSHNLLSCKAYIFILSSDRTFKLTSAMLLELLYDLWIVILLIIITALKIKLEIENIYSNNLFLLDWTSRSLLASGCFGFEELWQASSMRWLGTKFDLKMSLCFALWIILELVSNVSIAPLESLTLRV